ncbi:MAG: sugar transferase [Bacteroidales bacterium]|nr:sugar transferase [Bacteroidales bacterium]
MYRKFIKRVLDIAISSIALLLISWLLIVITMGLYFANRNSGVFFLQKRPGKDGKLFTLIKFKTMTDECDAQGNFLPDEMRITRIGSMVRSLSIDELPQLINVFRGDMSIIGPRPLLPEYMPLYSAEQSRRHLVRPGITGWAQCHGRNAISWKEKFNLDVWYVENYSFKVDCKVIILTVKKVLSRDGISHEGQATMEKFNGNN